MSDQVIWSNKPSINGTLHSGSGPFSTDIDFFEQFQSIGGSTDPDRRSAPQGLDRTAKPRRQNQGRAPAQISMTLAGFNEFLAKGWIFAILQRTIRCKYFSGVQRLG
ncbi:MAG: hypothetical protein AAGF82_04990 [Pseudomonadota bacterium]